MVDTHCHLVDPQFNRDLEDVLKRAEHAGIDKIINAGYDVSTSKIAIDQAKRYEWLLPAVGIHPNEAAEQSLVEMGGITDIIENNRVCAVGETGLDYYRDFSPRKAQRELFRKHINLARDKNLPLLIHNRNSIDDAIRILKEEKYHRGVFHCYSGSYEQAKLILGMGYFLGFGGILTFSRQTRDVFKKLPTDRIILETDSPFLAPTGHRGQRNEPSYILETLNFAAGTLEMLPERLEDIIDANAKKLFHLEEWENV
jgi:TatD DNase family protein